MTTQSNKDTVNKRKPGRPTVLTADVLQKLEDAFMNTLTDREACLYAGISESTLYNYQEANPDFIQRKEALKLTPNISAKNELVKGIKGNLMQARWWAEHKMPDFRPKVEITEPTGDISEAEEELRKRYDDELKETLIGKPPVPKAKKNNT